MVQGTRSVPLPPTQVSNLVSDGNTADEHEGPRAESEYRIQAIVPGSCFAFPVWPYPSAPESYTFISKRSLT